MKLTNLFLVVLLTAMIMVACATFETQEARGLIVPWETSEIQKIAVQPFTLNEQVPATDYARGLPARITSDVQQYINKTRFTLERVVNAEAVLVGEILDYARRQGGYYDNGTPYMEDIIIIDVKLIRQSDDYVLGERDIRVTADPGYRFFDAIIKDLSRVLK